MTRKHIWYVDAVVIVHVTLDIAATSAEEAQERARDGAWHGVKPNWDESRCLTVHKIKEGPGIQP